MIGIKRSLTASSRAEKAEAAAAAAAVAAEAAAAAAASGCAHATGKVLSVTALCQTCHANRVLEVA
jgi:cytochrome c5